MRHALRQLAKSPGFTVVAVATIALSIGVNTTAFTALNRLLLHTLPFPHPERLVQLWSTTPRGEITSQTPGDFVDECDSNTVFDFVSSYVRNARASLSEPRVPPVQVNTVWVSANFYPLFGIRTQLGRLPTDAEDRHLDRIAVVSNAFWREHYGADPNMVGRIVRLSSKDYTVVGVVTPEFDEPGLYGGQPAFFAYDGVRVNTGKRDAGWYRVAARLKPGVTMAQAQGEMEALARKLEHDFPKTNTKRTFKVVPYPFTFMGPEGTKLTWLVMALSGVVLLIACVNLANLQLVRSTGRTQEIAIRLALGSSRKRLVGLLAVESVLLSIVGGGLGLLVAKWSNAYVARFFDLDMPLDFKVIGFAFAASVAAGVLFGTVPALLASRTDIAEALKQGARGATADRSRRWLRQSLVALEFALALTLLAGAGFFVDGIYTVTHEELGWHADNALFGLMELDHDHYGELLDPRSLAFGDRLLAALRALPGVEAAALSVDSPAWELRPNTFRIEGQPVPEKGQELMAAWTPASPGYLKVYGIRLIQGRDFNEGDRPGSPPVVIVNESMARKYWPGENPIGKRIGDTDPEKPNWGEVVGVMADFKGSSDFYNPSRDGSTFLKPWAQNNHRFIEFSVRTAGDPRAFVETLRKTLGVLAPEAAPRFLETVTEAKDGSVAYFTFLRRTLVQTSLLGMLLAAVGIYGVVAQLTAERTKEIGIRMALGAQAGRMVWLCLENGMMLAGVGSLIGWGASAYLFVLLKRIVPMLPGCDPGLVAAITGILFLVATLACWLPARKAAKVDPVVALRSE